jgi:hypothetical protein
MLVAALCLSSQSLLLPTPQASSAPGPAAGMGRRALLQGAGALIALPPLAALADVRGANQEMPSSEKEVNKYLSSRGLGAMPVPKGFKPLLGYVGTASPANIDGQKVKERAFRDTLLVRFVYPSGWLVEVPSITENGEAGNIGANGACAYASASGAVHSPASLSFHRLWPMARALLGALPETARGAHSSPARPPTPGAADYIKGDSANFAAVALPTGESLAGLSKNKEFFKGWLSSQMSNDVYEDVKVKKIRSVTQDDGTEMLKIDFGYTLLTRAGFTVIRQGIASAVVANGAVVGLVSATTQLRYKELAANLETMVDSFRATNAKPPAFEGSII